MTMTKSERMTDRFTRQRWRKREKERAMEGETEKETAIKTERQQQRTKKYHAVSTILRVANTLPFKTSMAKSATANIANQQGQITLT